MDRTKAIRIVAVLCLAAISMMGSPGVQAQTSGQLGALSTFANAAAGATTGQRQAAYAVQGMCNYLIAQGYSTNGAPPGSSFAQPEGDLFLRCNELVRTALQFNNGQPQNRSLNYSDPSLLLGAIQQVNGEEVAAPGSLATQASAGQFSNITSRLSALRYGSLSAANRGRATAFNWNSPRYGDTYRSAFGNQDGPLLRDSDEPRFLRAAFMRTAAGAASEASAPANPEREPPAVSNPWGWFTEATYGFGKRDDTITEDGFDFDTPSVTAGVDYNFGSAVAGGSIGYDDYKADFRANGISNSGGEAHVKGISGSLFGAWFGDRWSLSGIASYGTLQTDVTRVATYTPGPGSTCTPACGVQNRTLTGDPDGHDAAVGATVEYSMEAGQWSVSPTLSVNYRKVKIDGYSETESGAPTPGGLALRYGSQDIDSMRSVVGVAVTRAFSRGFGVISPNFRAEWQHEYKNESRTIDASYVFDSSPGAVSRFPIATDAAAKDFGVVGVGLTALFSNRLQAYVTYDRVIGVSYLSSNSISVGVRGQF